MNAVEVGGKEVVTPRAKGVMVDAMGMPVEAVRDEVTKLLVVVKEEQQQVKVTAAAKEEELEDDGFVEIDGAGLTMSMRAHAAEDEEEDHDADEEYELVEGWADNDFEVVDSDVDESDVM